MDPSGLFIPNVFRLSFFERSRPPKTSLPLAAFNQVAVADFRPVDGGIAPHLLPGLSR